MNPLLTSTIIFVLVLAGLGAGAVLRSMVPKHHLDKESQDVIKLGVGLVGTIGALVLGLLIASAKTSFDMQSSQVRRITADVLFLDNMLAESGPEAQAIRGDLRAVVGPFVDRLWREKQVSSRAPFAADAAAERLYLAIQGLPAHDDMQRSLQAKAAQTATDITQTRLLLFAETGTVIPVPFLAMLVFWLVIIFASFGLFAPINATLFVALCLFALSASGAIFLILELSQPFAGMMQISSAPLREALLPLGR